MFNPRSMMAIMAVTFLGWVAFPAHAEQSSSFGDYVIHYNAFTTDFLSPQVAKSYDIPRSKNRALLNVSVLKSVMGTPSQAVKAIIRATATNLNGQLRTLEFREVTEGNAIYYLSTFPVANEEIMDFALEVTPEGKDAPYIVKFRKHFFTG